MKPATSGSRREQAGEDEHAQREDNRGEEHREGHQHTARVGADEPRRDCGGGVHGERVVVRRPMLAVCIEHDDVRDVDRLPVLDPSDHEAVPCGVPARRKRRLPLNPDGTRCPGRRAARAREVRMRLG